MDIMNELLRVFFKHKEILDSFPENRILLGNDLKWNTFFQEKNNDFIAAIDSKCEELLLKYPHIHYENLMKEAAATKRKFHFLSETA